MVNVVVTGQCTHLKNTVDERKRNELQVDMPNRRQLTGEQRCQTAAQLETTHTSATEMHFQKLSQMSDDELWAGNETACQTPPVFRQAAYE